LPITSGTSPLFWLPNARLLREHFKSYWRHERECLGLLHAPSTGEEPYGDTTMLDQYSFPWGIPLRDRTTSLFSDLETEPND
jgi:hypothetical protein